MKRVLVAGGGPAGLSAAIHAARAGAAVVLLERNADCGVKLLATGGGHCNLSNLRDQAEWPGLFGRRGRFVKPALDFLPREGLETFFAAIGQPLVAGADGFHLYPASNSAKAVRDALLAEALRLGVFVECGRRLDRLHVDSNGFVQMPGRSFDRLVLALGGRSFPSTGSAGDGARLARSIGYRTTPEVPGLVGLRAANLSPDLAGLVLPNALASLKAKGEAEIRGEGELLLTHRGISGPAVLDLSAAAAALTGERDDLPASGEAVLHLRWIAGMPPDAWRERFANWRRNGGGQALDTLLGALLPRRLAKWIRDSARVDKSVTAATLSAGDRDGLAELLGAFPARIVGSEGWGKAMITRGGVDVRQVDPARLAGKLTRNLYFAGEMLDVDGPCGGYNLHWAVAGGALAGIHAALDA